MSNIGFKRNKGKIHKIPFLLVTFLLLVGVVKPFATMVLTTCEEPAKQPTLQILVQFQVEAT